MFRGNEMDKCGYCGKRLRAGITKGYWICDNCGSTYTEAIEKKEYAGVG